MIGYSGTLYLFLGTILRNTVFFAATKKQRAYFNSIAARSCSANVFWYKKLKNQWPFFSSHNSLASYVEQELAKSENARGKNYTRPVCHLYKAILLLHSKWLFNKYLQQLKQSNAQTTVVWNGLKLRQQIFCLAAKQLSIAIRYMENGLVSGYTTLDAKGVNFGNSMPRDVALFKKAGVDTETIKTVPLARPAQLPKKYLFVPLQVNGDSQIICYSPWIKNMGHLAEVLLNLLPIAEQNGLKLVVKPHPKCPTPRAELEQRLCDAGIQVVHEIESKALVQHAQAVITINSTVGLEALAEGKRVIVLGQAFYNQNGISLSAECEAELADRIKNVETFEPDLVAIRGMFKVLCDQYQVNGDWRQAEPEHVDAVIKKLQELEV